MRRLDADCLSKSGLSALRFLADLATRLDALLAWLASESAGTEELAPLAQLAVKLRACAPRRRHRRALGRGDSRAYPFTLPQAEDRGADDRTEFWKRPQVIRQKLAAYGVAKQLPGRS